MKLVADTSAFLAVALEEPERPWLLQATKGQVLLAPPVLPYEIANALSALAKRGVLSQEQMVLAWDAASGIPVELMTFDVRAAVLLAGRLRIYAYDAFFLQCASETRCPLLTLDAGMIRAARQIGLSLVESK